jgi:UTP--glucose-1-phosphate uridylyltransferase
LLLTGLLEKEAPAMPTPNPLVNISRYVLPTTAIDLVRELPVDPQSGERRITDALLQLVNSGVPPLVYVTGRYFDIGDRQGLLAANNFMTRDGVLEPPRAAQLVLPVSFLAKLAPAGRPFRT